MGEIGRYYLLLFLICIGFVLPGLCKADSNAWKPALPAATKPQERMIFEGCTYKAELTYYAAQEKLYNHGSTGKLLAFLKDEMTDEEYARQSPLMEQIGQYVDQHLYKTAHEYSRAIFYECVGNSYQYFEVQPTDNAAVMIDRFEKSLDDAEEMLLPADIRPEVGA